MKAAPRRLRATRRPLIGTALPAGDDGTLSALGGRRRPRRLRVIRRATQVALWTLPAVAIQAILILLPGQPKVAFARFYWAVMCRLIGMDVRVIGQAAKTTADGRPVVYVSNHSSWLDIPVLGGQLDAAFIAKEDVARWPVISTIAKLGRTVYVRRTRGSTARERDEMRRRLAQGDNLVLFPEGTTSDGSRVLPFRSAFLSIAELPVSAAGLPPLVQPVSVVYDRLAGLPTGRASRPLFAWYGDMDIGSHFWRLAQHRGLRATVLLHTPLDPTAFPSRKALAAAVWSAVADGAATLRQNRTPRPLTAAPPPAARPGESTATDPVFA